MTISHHRLLSNCFANCSIEEMFAPRDSPPNPWRRAAAGSYSETWSAVAEARHEPATPLFASVPNQTQHDAKAVSTSCARMLASDSATALQINSPQRATAFTRPKRDLYALRRWRYGWVGRVSAGSAVDCLPEWVGAQTVDLALCARGLRSFLNQNLIPTGKSRG
jgi:hypothetical protein